MIKQWFFKLLRSKSSATPQVRWVMLTSLLLIGLSGCWGKVDVSLSSNANLLGIKSAAMCADWTSEYAYDLEGSSVAFGLNTTAASYGPRNLGASVFGGPTQWLESLNITTDDQPARATGTYSVAHDSCSNGGYAEMRLSDSSIKRVSCVCFNGSPRSGTHACLKNTAVLFNPVSEGMGLVQEIALPVRTPLNSLDITEVDLNSGFASGALTSGYLATSYSMASDIEGVGYGRCGFTDSARNITENSACLFFADVGSHRTLDITETVKITVPRSVFIFEAPSLEDILENRTLNLLRRIYISLPPDRDSTSLGAYSDDISAFTVYPGFSTRPGRSGWIANKSLSPPDGEGDWVFVTKSISGQGNQTKIYPTHVYSVPAADWRKLADSNINPYPEIELGVFGNDYAPQGELPLPYLLAVHYKNQGISLDDPAVSDWLQLIDPKIRAKIRQLYNGAGSASGFDENFADTLFEGLEPGEMIKDMIDKQKWLNDGGFNPAGSIVVTDITYSEDGRRWFLMTYSGMIEGIVDLTSTLPSLKNFLIEDTMRFSTEHAAMAQFSDSDGNPATLVQMESLSYIPARFFSDDRDALIYSTELEELGMSLQDSTTLSPPVWMARCESELPMGGERITADSE